MLSSDGYQSIESTVDPGRDLFDVAIITLRTISCMQMCAIGRVDLTFVNFQKSGFVFVRRDLDHRYSEEKRSTRCFAVLTVIICRS